MATYRQNAQRQAQGFYEILAELSESDANWFYASKHWASAAKFAPKHDRQVYCVAQMLRCQTMYFAEMMAGKGQEQ